LRAFVLIAGAVGGLICAWIRFTHAGDEPGALAFLYWLQEPVLYLHWVVVGSVFGLGLAVLWRLR